MPQRSVNNIKIKMVQTRKQSRENYNRVKVEQEKGVKICIEPIPVCVCEARMRVIKGACVCASA